MKTFLIILFSLGLIHPAFSAERGEIPPKPPGVLFHKRAPEFARWMITYNPSGTGSADSPVKFKQKIAVTKTKSVMVEQALTGNGRKWEKWIIGDTQFSKGPGDQSYRPYKANSAPGGVLSERLYTDYSVTDFPGFEWVTDEHYAGISKVANRECIVFSQPSGEGGESATAYVDLATRFPVVLTRGEETRLYEFQPAPQSVLALPADVQSYLQRQALRKQNRR